MKNSAYMYTCTFLLWGTFTISVIKQSSRLRIIVKDLPNFATKIDDSLRNNGISLTIMQPVSDPDYVRPNHGTVLLSKLLIFGRTVNWFKSS